MDHIGTKAIYMSVTELATAMGISRTAVLKKISNGQIKANKIGNSFGIPIETAHKLIGDYVEGEGALTDDRKQEIRSAIERVVKEYGETLKLLGKE